ncbi:hypothetical protein [Bosea vaviloviae]|uniref:hypothetical protein n=1 Tax=Bosea vaviloviae TaxID=1526658 RepID=UPI0011DF4FD5|nr:hypothetical protein [Bosea vaviloviae]
MAGDGIALGSGRQVVGRVPAGSSGGQTTTGRGIWLSLEAPLPEGADAVVNRVWHEHADLCLLFRTTWRRSRSTRSQPSSNAEIGDDGKTHFTVNYLNIGILPPGVDPTKR